MNTPIPDNVKRLFWGDDLNQLNWQDHEKYITQTILEKGDIEETRWLFSLKSIESIRSSLESYTLSPLSKNFWTLYLS